MFAHPLENRLAQSLNILGPRGIHEISAMVTDIHNHPEASLCAINRADENFLHYALRHSAESFFLIYDSIKESENIKELISMPDSDGTFLFLKSITWLNNLEIATTLFNRLESISSGEEAIQVFLAEKNGKTSVLHEATTRTDPTLFDFILRKIKQTYCNKQVSFNKTRNFLFVNKSDNADIKISETISALVNKKDVCGNTPLHCLALNTYAHPSQIANLLNSGADVFRKNQNNKTAFELLRNYKTTNIFNTWIREIFAALRPANQSHLLSYFEYVLTQNPNDETVKTLYFEFAGKKSLLALSQAHLNFNEDVPLTTGKNQDERIPSTTLYSPLIPTPYRNKIWRVEQSLNITRKSTKITPEMKKIELTCALWEIHHTFVNLQIQHEKFNIPFLKVMAAGWSSQFHSNRVTDFIFDTRALLIIILALMYDANMDLSLLLYEIIAILFMCVFLHNYLGKVINYLTDEQIKENLLLSHFILYLIPFSHSYLQDFKNWNCLISLCSQIFVLAMLTSKTLTYIGQKLMSYQIIIPNDLSTQISTIETLVSSFTYADRISYKIKTLLPELKDKEQVNFSEILNLITTLKETIDCISEEKDEQPSQMVAINM